MLESGDESHHRVRFLLDRYKERDERPWKQLHASADQTSTVVRDVVETFVEQWDRIGDEEFTTLFKLCQNTSDGISAEERRERIRDLNLPETDIERITSEIDDSIGSVGGTNKQLPIRFGDKREGVDVEPGKALYDCFRKIIENYDSEPALKEAVRDLAKINFHQEQSSLISPILHYLVPEVFPLINNYSAEGVELLTDETVSRRLEDYLDERETYIEIQETFDFHPNLRDLDYFLHWVCNTDNIWTAAIRNGINRAVWQVQIGSSKSFLWEHWRTEDCLVMNDWVGNWLMGERLLSGMTPGDIVIAANGQEKVLGIGVVSPAKIEFVGGTDDEITFSEESFTGEHIRSVDWIFTRDFTNPVSIKEWDISKNFHTNRITNYYIFEEFRLNLTNNYREEVLPALESLETTSVEYATTSRGFFVLQTDNIPEEGDPSERYRFTIDAPDAEALIDSDFANVVYCENDHLYATATLDSLNHQKKNGDLEYVATVGEYEEIEPVSIHAMRGHFGDSVSLDKPITQIESETYLRIEMGGISFRYFWLDVGNVYWYNEGGEWFDSAMSDWNESEERFYPIPEDKLAVFERPSAGDEVLVYDSLAGHIIGQAYVTTVPQWKSISDDDSPITDERVTYKRSNSGKYIKGINIRWHESREGLSWTEIAELSALDADLLADLDDTVFTELSEREYTCLLEGNTDEDELPTKPDGAAEIERQLKQNKQVIFYGPPGTGKTFDAKRIAKRWIHEKTDQEPTGEQIRSVTFHPSFSYEDFIEGLTADATESGSVTYDIEDGVLKHVAEDAKEALESTPAGERPPPFVLLIDEINRGNLAQIFGEVITLLEADKRGSFKIELAHSGDSFTLPSNLYIIGTMNTADQSISLVDTALRRRFRFIDFPPNLDVVFEQYDSIDAGMEAEELLTAPSGVISDRDRILAASVLAIDELNERILDAAQLGKGKQLGHTYLLGHDSKAAVVDAWRFDILPQLEEYYFGQLNRLREDLLDETGEKLFDWNTERIQAFTAKELYTALCALNRVENPVEISSQEDESSVESNSDPADDAWEQGERTTEAFRERLSSTLDPADVEKLYSLIDAAADIGSLDPGDGDYASLMIKADSVNPSVGIIQIEQDGTIDFRWNWVISNDNSQLLPSFVDDAAKVFESVSGYQHEWEPEGKDNDDFESPELAVQDLAQSDIDDLIESLREFVQRAIEQ